MLSTICLFLIVGCASDDNEVMTPAPELTISELLEFGTWKLDSVEVFFDEGVYEDAQSEVYLEFVIRDMPWVQPEDGEEYISNGEFHWTYHSPPGVPSPDQERDIWQFTWEEFEVSMREKEEQYILPDIYNILEVSETNLVLQPQTALFWQRMNFSQYVE